MKKINSILLAMMVIIGCCLSFMITVFAETAPMDETPRVISSTAIGTPKFDIQSILEEKVTKECVDESYGASSLERPQEYTYDTSIYLLEYNVSTEYWDTVSEMTYKGMTDALDSGHPTIYVPIFGEIADTKGNMLNRVIGHIKLSYDWTADDYKFRMTLYNLTSEDFKDKKNVWFYETIVDYLNDRKEIAQQVLLIQCPTAESHGSEQIALIQTENNTAILDISNTLRVETDETQTNQSFAYSISEYITLRKNVESNQNAKPTYDFKLLYWLLILPIGVAAFLIVKKFYKRSAK